MRITPPLQPADNKAITNKRIEYIDSLKGICITLVVAYHCNLYGHDTPLSLLRMPLYFVLSGLFFKDYGSWFANFLTKTNKLIIPFLFFYTISYLLFCITRILIGGEIDLPYFNFVDPQKSFVNGVLWFLLALFCANMVFYPICKYIKRLWLQGIACFAISAAMLYLSTLTSARLPLYLDSGIFALPFFWVGYALRQLNLLTIHIHRIINAIIIVALISIPVISTYTLGFSNVDIGGLRITGSPIIYFIMSPAIVLGVIAFFKLIGSVPLLRFVGRYSLVILGTHNIIAIYLTSIASHFGFDNTSYSFCLCQFIISFLVSITLIPVLTKFFPYFTAQRDLLGPKGEFLRGKTAGALG